MKKIFNILFMLLLTQLLLSQDAANNGVSKSSTGFEQRRELFPNASYRSILTPTGWGGYSTYVFAVLAGTFPQIYHNKPDLGAAIGFGTGNSYKRIGFVGMLNINDVSGVDNFSYNLIASRHVGKGSSISIGGLHLFRNHEKSDSKSSFFLAFSYAVQSLPSKTPGFSKLNYTIGIGNGRFYEKSMDDINSGKKSKGTAVFGSVSYEIFKRCNFIVEWTGINLGIATAWRPSYKLPAVAVGVADLTRNSGDNPRFVFSVGQSLNLKNNY